MTTTLLAIDDSKTIRRVLEITFAGEAYRTVLSDNADDALSKVRAERPAVALIDAGLGTMSGYDLCQQLKREAPGVAVILLSSKQAPYDRARGSSVGADDFIDKPFDTQQLIDKVAAIARRTGDVAARPAPVASAPVVASTQTAGSIAVRPRTNTLAYGTSSNDLTAPAPVPATSHGLGQRSPTLSGSGAPAAPAPTYAMPGPAPAPAGNVRPPGGGFSPQPAPSPAAAPFAGAPVQSRTPEPPAAAPAQTGPTAVSPVSAIDGQFAEKLAGLGLTQAQVQGVLALSRDVVEKVVWEVVPVLAETLIKEELRRLTTD